MRLPALIAALALVGCATTEQLPNGCVVDALSHRYAESSRDQLVGATEFNEVLLVVFNDQKSGHALSIFEHNGEIWAYDYERGSRRISRTMQHSPLTVACLIYPGPRVKSALWL